MIEALRARVAEVRAQLARVAAQVGQDAEREKASVVALNMASNGAPPTETARYLTAHFDLPDAPRIIADAYAHSARMRGRAPAATPLR